MHCCRRGQAQECSLMNDKARTIGYWAATGLVGLAFLTGGAFTPRSREFLDRVDNRRMEKPLDLAQLDAIIDEVTRPA